PLLDSSRQTLAVVCAPVPTSTAVGTLSMKTRAVAPLVPLKRTCNARFGSDSGGEISWWTAAVSHAPWSTRCAAAEPALPSVAAISAIGVKPSLPAVQVFQGATV